ncbi:hypothetical protein TNCV_5045841 [Trichonephila clavipes]|uniref:Uncharacterized protein n=1 Tax=Trichonephila clavipes TaxID=2585209 RepID=A0A8X6WI01_TRICX|nr:hypothetical protein TNCV_5045841 [Trichonephila clavipes]
MHVCKCIVPSRHGGTLNSLRAASPLVRLVEGEERWEAPDNSQGVLSQNCYSKAFGDEPRNFEPRSTDEDDTRAGTTSPNFHTNGRTFEHQQI